MKSSRTDALCLAHATSEGGEGELLPLWPLCWTTFHLVGSDPATGLLLGSYGRHKRVLKENSEVKAEYWMHPDLAHSSFGTKMLRRLMMHIFYIFKALLSISRGLH